MESKSGPSDSDELVKSTHIRHFCGGGNPHYVEMTGFLFVGMTNKGGI